MKNDKKESAPTGKMAGMLRMTAKVVIVLLVIACLAMGSVLLGQQVYTNYQYRQSVYSTTDYSIVFLNNNLFYFCQIEDFNKDYIKCNDPFYLVKKSETQPDGTKADKIFVSKPSVEEIYQPEGPIFLMKTNIVYVAKIGSKSSVLDYINKNQ